MLADTHAHLYWDSFQPDLTEVLQRAKEAHLGIIINVGVDVKLSEKALKQVEGELSQFEGISFYSTIGIHPHEVYKYSNGEWIHRDIEKLEQIYRSNPEKVIGVGECGLDFMFESNPDFVPSSLSAKEYKAIQIKLFQAQIDLAEKLGLPVIAHIRDDRSKDPENSECWDLALEMLNNHPAILHCYSGLSKTTNYLLQTTNYLISFAANITYPRNNYLREAAKKLPLDKIVLETDSPFLSPQSKRGQRNEPAAVLESAQLIAEIKGVSLEKIEHQTTENVKKLFHI